MQRLMDFGMFNSNGVSLLMSSPNIFVENEAEVIEVFNKTMFSRHVRQKHK